jgi:hypothetical protein
MSCRPVLVHLELLGKLAYVSWGDCTLKTAIESPTQLTVGVSTFVYQVKKPCDTNNRDDIMKMARSDEMMSIVVTRIHHAGRSMSNSQASSFA